ncbi:MAG TPA: glycosyltransferase family 87 protein [Acidimicrobiia bacterium]
MRRWIPAVVVAASVSLTVVAWPTGSVHETSDAAPDYLFVHAAWNGINPYDASWSSLADLFGGPHQDYGPPSKTPAVPVVQAGWLLFSADQVQQVARIVNTAALVGVCYLSARIAGRRFVWWMATPVVALYPVQISWLLGNPIFVWVFLILLTWWWTQHYDGWWVGVPLGVAAAVRLWPGLLAVALWRQGKRRSAVGVGSVAVGLNLAGLLVPGVRLEDAVRGLTTAGEVWLTSTANVSMVRLFGGSLWVTVLLVAAAVLFVWWHRSVEVAAVAAVLVTPLSWSSYYLAAAPVFVKLWPWSAVPIVLISATVWWWLAPAGGLLLLVLHRRVEVEGLSLRVDASLLLSEEADVGGGQGRRHP